jgi:sugar lactone lactonase YvrE
VSRTVEATKLASALVIVGALTVIAAGGAMAQSPAASSTFVPGGAAGIPPTSCGPAGSLASGTIATIAGTGQEASTGDDGPALDAAIDPGLGIAVGPDDDVYFGDAEGAIRRVTTDGTMEVYASGIPDPQGLGFDAAGNLYVISSTGSGTGATTPTSQILRIAPDRTVTAVAGTGLAGSTGDEGPATQAAFSAWTLAVAPDGHLYFDDVQRYRSVDTQGVIHAFAGTGATGFSGDGGPAPEAQFGLASDGMSGPAVAPDGSVLLGDPGNRRIRRVDSAGVIDTYFTSPKLKPSPYGLAVAPDGVLYIADWQAAEVFGVEPDGTSTTIAGTGASLHSGDCVPATTASLYGAAALAVHDGAIYILEQGYPRIRVIVP